MKTRQIPAIVMLCGGLVTCIITFLQQRSLSESIMILFWTLISFYAIGLAVKIVLDRTVKKELDDAAAAAAEADQDQEQEEQEAAEDGAPQPDQGTQGKNEGEEMFGEEEGDIF